MSDLAIGEVARRAGLRPSAIRYYESVDLLPEPRRVHGQRRYDPSVLDHLTFIQISQEAGFTVAEVRDLLHGAAAGETLSDHWRTLAERKLTEVEALIVRARAMKALLEEGIRCGCLTHDDCNLMARATRDSRTVPIEDRTGERGGYIDKHR